MHTHMHTHTHTHARARSLTRTQDGGFLCVPGFHRHIAEWAGLAANQDYKELMAEAFDYLEV